MKKIALTTLIKKITLGAGLTLMAIPMTYADEAAPAAPQINAKAYVLMDYDSGKILTEANADQSRKNHAERYGGGGKRCLGNGESHLTWLIADVPQAGRSRARL